MALQFNLDTVKKYLKLPVDFTDDDELIESLFDFCSPDVEKFIGFDLSATDYTDEVHINNWWDNVLNTKAFPILDPTDPTDDIIVITINDGASIGLANFQHDPVKGNIVINENYNLRRNTRMNTIKITYRAGFSTFPKRAEYAIYKLIRAEYKEDGNELKSVGDLSSNWSKRDLIGNMPVDIYRMLNTFRRNVV